ncbi:cytotoxin/hemolysin [Micromonospora sp. M42]|nr:cytotoxin/hemolysin [Micromonospora sp. M42]
MARRTRLDAELVRRGLARSREQAAALVEAGRVQLRGVRARKPAAGRPGRSAAGDRRGPGRRVRLPGRPQTGRRARRVRPRRADRHRPALPGRGRVDWRVHRRAAARRRGRGGRRGRRLRAARLVAAHRRAGAGVRAYERAYAHAGGDRRSGRPDGGHLSFISLRLVLPALAACTGPGGDLALMVKPQFEVGKERVGAGGVVRDPALRAEAVLDVAAAAAGLGLGLAGVAASPLPGPSGNVEFFVWLRGDAPAADPERVRAVVAAGPQGAATTAATTEEVSG